ncbi:MAG: pitrilysin family protein [Acidobacteriota bacterium]
MTLLPRLFLLFAAMALPASFSDGAPDPATQSPGTPPDSASVPAGAVTEVRLENGLKVLLRERHDWPVVAVWCGYRVGSKDEQMGSTGMAHWLEHVTFRGTRGISAEGVRGLLDSQGGEWGAYTFLDQTAYFQTVPRTALEAALRLEAERMSASLLEVGAIEQERSRVNLERARAFSSSQFLLDSEVTATALRAHPYRWPVFGWGDDLRRLSRTDLLEFYRRFYSPENAVLVLAGDFKTQAALELVKKAFEPIARKPDVARPRINEPRQEGEKRIRIQREGGIPCLEVAFPAPDILNDEFYTFLVMDAVLTGARSLDPSAERDGSALRSSRLFRALVERQIAIRAGSALVATQQPFLYKLRAVLTDPLQFQTAEEALLSELERLKDTELTDAELAKAKNQWIAQSYLAQAGAAGNVNYLGYFETIASHRLVDSLAEKIQRVSKEDVRRVAIKYFGANSRTVGWFVPLPKQRRIEVERLALRQDGFPLGTSLAGALAGETLDSPSNLSVVGLGSSPAPAAVEVAAESVSIPSSFQPQLKILPNKVSVVVAQSSVDPVITIRVCTKAGSMHETDDQEGLARLTARMLLEGTRNLSATQFAERLEFLGARVHSETDYVSSTLSVRGLSKDSERLIEALIEAIRMPLLNKDSFDRVKASLAMELRSREEQEGFAAERAFRERIYASSHPFRRMAAGRAETVERLKLADVSAFHRMHYRPDHVIITVVGDVQAEPVYAWVEKMVGDWTAAGPAEPFSIPAAPPVAGGGQPHVITTSYGDFSETWVGNAGISVRHPDYYAMRVLLQILQGSGKGGRLGKILAAESGTVLKAGAVLDAGLSEGPFAIHLTTVPQAAQRVLDLLKEEFERISTEGVTAQELEAVQQALLNTVLVQLSAPERLGRELERIQLHDLGNDYLQRLSEQIKGVTLDRLTDCLRTRLNFDQMTVVVAGPGVRATNEAAERASGP